MYRSYWTAWAALLSLTVIMLVLDSVSLARAPFVLLMLAAMSLTTNTVAAPTIIGTDPGAGSMLPPCASGACVFLQERLIDSDAEAGPVRDLDHPVPDGEPLLRQFLQHRVAAQRVFEDEARR